MTPPPPILGSTVLRIAFVDGRRCSTNCNSEVGVSRSSFVCLVLCRFLAVLCGSRLYQKWSWNPPEIDVKIDEKSIKWRPGAFRAASGAPGGSRNIKREHTVYRF